MWRFHSFCSLVYVFVHLFVYGFLFVTSLLRYDWVIAKLRFSQKNIVICNFDHKCFLHKYLEYKFPGVGFDDSKSKCVFQFCRYWQTSSKGVDHFTPTIHAGEGLFPQSVINTEHCQTFGFLPIRYLRNSTSV